MVFSIQETKQVESLHFMDFCKQHSRITPIKRRIVGSRLDEATHDLDFVLDYRMSGYSVLTSYD